MFFGNIGVIWQQGISVQTSVFSITANMYKSTQLMCLGITNDMPYGASTKYANYIFIIEFLFFME